MNAVTSLYIPHVEKNFNAEYIADIFSRNGLAQVSRVYIEPYKTIIKNRLNYNRAYILIDSWHETEAAYSFIQRLRNPSAEARLVHSDDNWWAVDINRNPSVFKTNNRVLTVFTKPVEAYETDDSLSTMAVGNAAEIDDYLKEIDDEREQWYNEIVKVDAEKTKQLRDVVARFNEQLLMQQEDNSDYEAYLREIDEQRDLWYSEQYIWDELCI